MRLLFGGYQKYYSHIWAMTRDQYGISTFASQTSLRGDTSGGVAKWQRSSQATFTESLIRKSSYATKNITLNWFYSHYLTITYCIDLAPVVQKLDSTIHRINHYPADKYYGNQLRYLPDSDLSGGLRYPTFEQPGPGLQLTSPP